MSSTSARLSGFTRTSIAEACSIEFGDGMLEAARVYPRPRDS